MMLSSAAVSSLDDDPPRFSKLGHHRIRLDFQYDPGTSPPEVLTATYHVCTALNIHFKDVSFLAHDEKPIVLDDWPEQDTFNDRFSVTFAEGRTKRHVNVGFVIRTSHSFSDIKNRIRQVLKNHNAWIYQHQLKFTQLDVVPLGFLYRTNTRFYSHNVVQTELREKLLARYTLGSDELQQAFKDQFSNYLNKGDFLELPGFMVVPANVRSGNEITHAFEVHVAREDTKMMKYLLEAIFSAMDPESTQPWFIPYSLRHDSADAFRSVLRRQNEFLVGHRNIPLAGITSNQMHEDIMWNNRLQTPRDILLNLPGIIRVESTPRTHDLRKFNVATTADTYVANVQWVDKFLASMFNLTTETDKFASNPFPVPTRMGRQSISRTQSVTNRTKSSDYHEFLKNQFPTTVGTPPPPRQNAWNKMIRSPPVFNYDTQSFPPLSDKPVPPATAAPMTPNRYSGNSTMVVTPNNSTSPSPEVSVTTPSTMTESAAKTFIQECIQAEQIKLQETLRHEREQHNKDMQKFIQQAITQTRESMQQPSTSLYVTETMLNDKFDRFKQEILEALNPSLVSKRQPPATPPRTPDRRTRETPVNSPVHKKTRENSPTQQMDTDSGYINTPDHSVRTECTALSSPGSEYAQPNLATQPSQMETALSQGRGAVEL